LRILKEDNVPVEQFTSKLLLIAQRYVSMLDRLAALDPEDAEAQNYIEEAQAILRRAASRADYDRSDELLSNAEDAQGRSLERVELLEREAHEAASRLRRSKAATRAERGELSLTRLDYIQAAHHFSAAAELVSRDDFSIGINYLVRSAGALSSHGDEKGDNAVLARAISIYGDVLSAWTRDRVPLQWAMTQNNLGNALLTLGDRESGTERLERAVRYVSTSLRHSVWEFSEYCRLSFVVC
jgi:tetratricopeptide (TPR) repeat protein